MTNIQLKKEYKEPIPLKKKLPYWLLKRAEADKRELALRTQAELEAKESARLEAEKKEKAEERAITEKIDAIIDAIKEFLFFLLLGIPAIILMLLVAIKLFPILNPSMVEKVNTETEVVQVVSQNKPTDVIEEYEGAITKSSNSK